MAKQRLSERNRRPREPRIEADTKKSVVATVLFGLAVILGLSTVDFAGPAGTLIFSVLKTLFGVGSYLIPVVTAAMGVLLLLPGTRRFVGATVGGTAAFTVFCLGLIELSLPGQGGWVGSAVGLLERPFGRVAAMVITTTLALASLLVATNAALRIPRWSRAKEAGEGGEVSDEIIEAAQGDSADENEEDTEEEQEASASPAKNGRRERDEEDDDEPVIAEVSVAPPRRGGGAPNPRPQ